MTKHLQFGQIIVNLTLVDDWELEIEVVRASEQPNGRPEVLGIRSFPVNDLT